MMRKVASIVLQAAKVETFAGHRMCQSCSRNDASYRVGLVGGGVLYVCTTCLRRFAGRSG
jgi:hypothetical protein